MYCKSFFKEVDRCKILFDSIQKYNKENIPFYVSCPSEDTKIFQNTLGTTGYTLLTDEYVIGKKFEQNWVTQQIIKSSFWKLKLSTHYLMIDSDSYFIRDFYIKDFLYSDDIPYTVMHEQKDLFSWTVKHNETLGFNPMISYRECREPIANLFGRKGRIYDFGPTPTICANVVWETLEEEYIKPNNLTFEQLIVSISSEFSWYGEWLLTKKPFELWPIEPMFKVFHYLPQYKEYKNMGYTLDHWNKNYLGVVMQSSSGLPMKY